VATRIVADSGASLAPDSHLVRTAGDVPVLIAVSPSAPKDNRERLADAGCHVLICSGHTHAERLDQLLDELGQRRMTNILVEGGSRLLGSLWDAQQIDEVHVFIAPKLAGGDVALSPVGGQGLDRIPEAPSLAEVTVQQLQDDIYLHSRVRQIS
jgi:diaminohydroxyphosphoribosylaminopyrimidine deaminase/5-amino-6-(5-phosphoribosylamino)uracil reductase